MDDKVKFPFSIHLKDVVVIPADEIESVRYTKEQILEQRINRMEQYMLFLGDLCDSPDSLRGHIAETCEFIVKKRTAEKKLYPKYVGRWRAFLTKDKE